MAPQPQSSAFGVIRGSGSPSKRICAWQVAAISAGHGAKVPTRSVAPGTALTCATPVKWRAPSEVMPHYF